MEIDPAAAGTQDEPFSGTAAPSGDPRAISRRTMLRRGAIAGGTLAWAVPTIQVISMTSAAAQTPSGVHPGEQPSDDHDGQPSGVRPSGHASSTDSADQASTDGGPAPGAASAVDGHSDGTASQHQASAGGPPARTEALAATGSSGTTTGIGIAGIGLALGGAAAVYAGGRMTAPSDDIAVNRFLSANDNPTDSSD